MLDKLCIESGFCGAIGHAPFDQEREAWTAGEFALEMLRAEGIDPLVIEGIGPSQSEWFKLIRKRFVATFGQSVCVADFERPAD